MNRPVVCRYLDTLKFDTDTVWCLDTSILTPFIPALVRLGDVVSAWFSGLSPEGVDLLERYVDTTGDVQTACCVCVQGLSSADLARDPRVRAWISEYRALLDTWRLWHERYVLRAAPRGRTYYRCIKPYNDLFRSFWLVALNALIY